MLDKIPLTHEHKGIKLELTCRAMPEQYDAFDVTGKQVGYLRLRHGGFTVECPDVGDEEVYYNEPSGDYEFEAHERVDELNNACVAIKTWCKSQ